MKKSILILSAIAGLTYLTSCGGEEKPTEVTYTQAQLDSINKAKEDSILAAQNAANDSMLAKMAADSIAAANAAAANAANTKTASKPAGKTSKPVTKKPTTKPDLVTKEPTKPATVGNGKPSMKSNEGTVGNGKPSMREEATKSGTVGNGKPSMK